MSAPFASELSELAAPRPGFRLSAPHALAAPAAAAHVRAGSRARRAAPRRAAPGPIRSRGGATAGPQAQTSPQSRPQAPTPPEGGATSQKRGLRGPAPGLSQLPNGE